MGTNQLTEEQLKVAFCEVRKAHRLIYEYQRRMQDLTWFIKTKLGFPEYQGHKQFSNTISPQHNIKYDLWSWDWIYTYMFEYRLGTKKGKSIDITACLVQISDNGYYKNHSNQATQLSSFTPVEDSDSLLTFYLVAQQNNVTKHWNPLLESLNDTQPKVNLKENYTEIFYPVPLYRFENEDATMTVLREFVQYCKTKANVELEIQE